MARIGKAAERARKGLNASPAHLMHRALQLAQDIYARDVGKDGLTQRQYALLAAVEAGAGRAQAELVRATGIDRSTLADLAARMQTRGLVLREKSPEDARALTITLTEEGRARLDEARPRVAAADRRILAMLPRKRRDGFLKTLAELSAVAEIVPDVARADRKTLKQARKDQRKGRVSAPPADPAPDAV